MSENEIQVDDSAEIEVLDDTELLEARLHQLESRLSEIEDNLPDTWLLSQSLWKRVITVYGYYLLVALVISIPIFICSFGFMLLGMFTAMATNGF